MMKQRMKNQGHRSATNKRCLLTTNVARYIVGKVDMLELLGKMFILLMYNTVFPIFELLLL